jgi:hypothetical protein
VGQTGSQMGFGGGGCNMSQARCGLSSCGETQVLLACNRKPCVCMCVRGWGGWHVCWWGGGAGVQPPGDQESV